MLEILKKLFRAAQSRLVVVILVAMMPILGMLPANAEDAAQGNDSAQILHAFNEQHREAEHDKSITDKDKMRVMFLLGVALITLVMITGALGIAMGLYGKPVFLAHMIFAGLSMTLAIAHAIVGMVWFYPF